MTLGSVLTFSPLTLFATQDLLMLRLRLTEPRFCWSEEITRHFVRCTYKVDVIHVGEGLHLCAGFFQEGMDCKAEEEGSHGITLSDSTG